MEEDVGGVKVKIGTWSGTWNQVGGCISMYVLYVGRFLQMPQPPTFLPIQMLRFSHVLHCRLPSPLMEWKIIGQSSPHDLSFHAAGPLTPLSPLSTFVLSSRTFFLVATTSIRVASFLASAALRSFSACGKRRTCLYVRTAHGHVLLGYNNGRHEGMGRPVYSGSAA